MLRPAFALLAALALAGCSALPTSGARDDRGAAQRPPIARPGDAGASRQCLAELGSAGAGFTPVPDRYPESGCSLVGTVQLSDLASDTARLGIGNIGPVTCELGQAFAAWARFGADRAARQLLGSPLRSIETFGSYSCRDVAGSGRRSAHASAAAIDISGFVLADGRRITVQSGWDGLSEAERRFLRVVHQSACRRFGTVLGPDYNAAHRDHLHVEGVSAGRSYCR
jgi:hypothetical protein